MSPVTTTYLSGKILEFLLQKKTNVCVCVARHLKPDFHRSMVWIGVHKLQKAAVKYVGILNYVKHPDYQALSRGYKNNIALIKLKKKITFSNKVTAVSLPTVDDTFGSFSECWITGWGTIGNEGKF